jgi:hypothetical protein
MQVTAPMPLEGIHVLFRKAVSADRSSQLLPQTSKLGSGMVHVTTEFFQTSPGGITSGQVHDDVLAFFSLVMSYAKQAKQQFPVGESPKTKMSIMPRSDFVTLYNQVKYAIKSPLYDVVKILACYENDGVSAM